MVLTEHLNIGVVCMDNKNCFMTEFCEAFRADKGPGIGSHFGLLCVCKKHI